MTRTAKLLAAGCFVLATVAACGSQAASTGSGGAGGASLTASAPPPATTPVATTPPPVNTTTEAVPSQPRSPVPAGQVDTQGMTPQPNGVSVTKDGMFVVFNAAQSGCEHVTAALLSQASAAVTIQVRTTVVNHGGQVCPMIVREVPLTVHLSAPLGARHVVFQHVQATTSGK